MHLYGCKYSHCNSHLSFLYWKMSEQLSGFFPFDLFLRPVTDKHWPIFLTSNWLSPTKFLCLVIHCLWPTSLCPDWLPDLFLYALIGCLTSFSMPWLAIPAAGSDWASPPGPWCLRWAWLSVHLCLPCLLAGSSHTGWTTTPAPVGRESATFMLCAWREWWYMLMIELYRSLSSFWTLI